MQDCYQLNNHIFWSLLPLVLIYFMAVYATVAKMRNEDRDAFERFGSPTLGLADAMKNSYAMLRVLVFYRPTKDASRTLLLSLYSARTLLILTTISIIAGLIFFLSRCPSA